MSGTMAEEKAETVFITLGNVKAEALADKLADTRGEGEADTLSDRLGNVEETARVVSLACTLAKNPRHLVTHCVTWMPKQSSTR